MWFVKLLTETLMDNGKGSFGRLYALPFLGAALILSFADGVLELIRRQDVSETVIILASIAAGLYGGSKSLTTMQKLKGKNAKTNRSTSS